MTWTLMAGLLAAGLAAGPGAARALQPCFARGRLSALRRLPLSSAVPQQPVHPLRPLDPDRIAGSPSPGGDAVNTNGQRISVAEYDRNDGFSPGGDLVVHIPGLDNPAAFRRTGAVPAIGHYPFRGSAIVIWDGGPGHVQPPPFANVPPGKSPTDQDPHEDVRNTPAARLQKSEFLTPDGAVFDVCSAQPCRTAAYTP